MLDTPSIITFDEDDDTDTGPEPMIDVDPMLFIDRDDDEDIVAPLLPDKVVELNAETVIEPA